MVATTEFIASFILGVSLHIFVLRVGEWDLAARKLLAGAAAAPFFGALVLTQIDLAGSQPHDYWSALKASSCLVATSILGIYSSMLVYRAAFHRLNRFPGPFVARLSNLYIATLACKEHQEYMELHRLHQAYGDVVRIGASTLSITDPRALQALHSAGSKCTKGPWYLVLAPMASLQTERDPSYHTYRRRVWDRGFSVKALRNYEPRVSLWTDKLLDNIGSKQGQPIDASLWFNFYSFDVMGDLSLGESFGMLDRGKEHFFMRSLHSFMRATGMFGHIMWMMHVFNSIPIVSSESAKFQTWVAEAVQKRMKSPPEVPDVFSWILEEYNSKSQPTKQETLNINADGITITIAGSDTTAAALTCLFLELAIHADVAQKLQEEVDESFREDPSPDHNALLKLKYLQACIDEALRLHPVVPSGGQRVTPPEGLKIGNDLFIPGGVIVQTPTFTLHRDQRSFAQPDEFIPERWTTRPELNKNASVYSPFNIGPYNCVGKQLALMEIRSVTSRILRQYNVALAPNQTKEAFVGGLVDGFTLACPRLDLVFTPRA